MATKMKTLLSFSVMWTLLASCVANPDAKRLYDDLLSNYNRLIRPVSNNTDTVLVKLGLRLSQLIDLVSSPYAVQRCFNPSIKRLNGYIKLDF